jgi:di/tricarboxylate transporter
MNSFPVQLETQSLNMIVAGFSFASAIAWMDAVRWVISQVISNPKTSGTYFFLTALVTTLLSIFVYFILSSLSKRVVPPQKPVFAVTR